MHSCDKHYTHTKVCQEVKLSLLAAHDNWALLGFLLAIFLHQWGRVNTLGGEEILTEIQACIG